jgi:hypothetical protein
MQPRRPRLGDVLDDYCPRERRVTNHVVVAMIEDDVKQHGARPATPTTNTSRRASPARVGPKAVPALADGAESFEAKPVLAPPLRGASESTPDSDGESDDSPQSEPFAAPPDDAAPPMAASAEVDTADENGSERLSEDEGPVHRRLIRATLPRPEGHVPERKEPEFTIRQQGSRGAAAERWTATASATGRRAVSARVGSATAAVAGIRGSAASGRAQDSPPRGTVLDAVPTMDSADVPTAQAIHAASGRVPVPGGAAADADTRVLLSFVTPP